MEGYKGNIPSHTMVRSKRLRKGEMMEVRSVRSTDQKERRKVGRIEKAEGGG